MRNLRLLLTRSEPVLLAAALPAVLSNRCSLSRNLLTGDSLGSWNPSLFRAAPQWLSSLAAPRVQSQERPSKKDESGLGLLDSDEELTPKAIVEQLDRFIVGQQAAKRAVAIALRNRWRRHKIAAPLSSEIIPKNILMIGPTGCGKTEIARRLAKLASAPFVKVEATKFTEVGFHGRDVDQIIRDLVDNAVLLMKQNLRSKMLKEIERAVEEKILEKLVGPQEDGGRDKETFRRLLQAGQLDEEEIEFDPGTGSGKVSLDGPYGSEAFPGIFVKVDKVLNVNKTDKRRMKVAEVKPLLEEQELEKILPQDMIQREAIKSVEQDGIVFIDEIDKIVVNPSYHHGADASSEGVQRDLLPIIEGSVVNTKLGNVSTDHILFICSGAFHHVKPSDMLAELQGRLPIRVELKGLTKHDFYRILTEPETSMLRQQEALLETEGVKLCFTEASIREVARVAEEVNKTVDNIGARRLYTVLERILEEISFNAPELAKKARQQGEKLYTVIIDKEQVIERVGELMKKADLSKYIL